MVRKILCKVKDVLISPTCKVLVLLIINLLNIKKKKGITVSGGEALLQMEFVTELFEIAKKNGVHTTLDIEHFLRCF